MLRAKFLALLAKPETRIALLAALAAASIIPLAEGWDVPAF